MCLRNKDDPEYDVHDFESVMFAYLHEIAHVTTDVKQHEPGFWETFKWLLKLKKLESIRILILPKHQSIIVDIMLIIHHTLILQLRNYANHINWYKLLFFIPI